MTTKPDAEVRPVPATTENRDSDPIRGQLHAMWASVADAWGEHADYIDARSAALTDRMLELSDLRAGERVLELACGAGGLGLAAAQRVGPSGEVVLSDIAQPMVAIASARAGALGLSNVTTRILDLEEIDQPEGVYEVVLCREGMMFAQDHARAAGEIRRVLRPGGRFALAAWGPRERNPWLGIVLDAVSEQFGAPVPPPGVPGPFALEDADRLAGLLSDAGLSDVVIEEIPVPMHAPSFEEWWTRTCALAGPLANMLKSLPDDAAGAIRDRARDAASAYETSAGLEFPGLTLLASGRRV